MAGTLRVVNKTRGTELGNAVRPATTFWSRLVGLLGRSGLKPGEGLYISPCSSVHTAFMRFAIDVIYIDSSNRVIKTVPVMRPFRASAAFGRDRSVLELPAGTIEASGTEPGDELAIDG